jgi:hypothetical protein
MIKGSLQNIEYPQHIQPVSPIRQRLPSLLDTIQEVLAFKPEGLLHLNSRHIDVAKAQSQRVPIRVILRRTAIVMRAVNALVVDAQFLGRLHVVKHCHLSAANHCETPYLVGV